MSWHVCCRAGVAHLSSLFQNLGLRHACVDRQYSEINIKEMFVQLFGNRLSRVFFYRTGDSISLYTVLRRS